MACPCGTGTMATVETSAAGVLWRCTSCGLERFVGTPKPAGTPIPAKAMRRLLSAAMGRAPRAHEIKRSSR